MTSAYHTKKKRGAKQRKQWSINANRAKERIRIEREIAAVIELEKEFQNLPNDEVGL